MNEEVRVDPASGAEAVESIVFEINFALGSWRKVKKKKIIKR